MTYKSPGLLTVPPAETSIYNIVGCVRKIVDYLNRTIPFTSISGTLAVNQGGTGDTGTAWAAFTPTITSQTGSITAYTINSCAFKQIGKTVFYRYDFTITTNGTGAAHVLATVPVTPVGKFTISGDEFANTGKMIGGGYGSVANPTGLSIAFYDGTYPGANGNNLVFSGVYEAA